MTVTTWSAALKELAEPRPSGEYIKRSIERAAGLADLRYWRAFDIWYGKARRIDATEAQRISAALEQKREDEAQNELQDLRARLLKMESRLASSRSNSRRTSRRHDGPSLPGFGDLDSAVAGPARRR